MGSKGLLPLPIKGKEYLKKIQAGQQKSSPSRDPVPLMHTMIHFAISSNVSHTVPLARGYNSTQK